MIDNEGFKIRDYSSASNYIHNEGIIEITLAGNPLIDTVKSISMINQTLW